MFRAGIAAAAIVAVVAFWAAGDDEPATPPIKVEPGKEASPFIGKKWRSEAGLALVGPRYFGYDVDYVPVEQRYG